MYKEKVGTVTEMEKIEVEKLHERNIALAELVITLNNPALPKEDRDYLYEKVLNDIGKTKIKLQNWWNLMAEIYQWKSSPDGRWEIDFKTNDIYLISVNK